MRLKGMSLGNLAHERAQELHVTNTHEVYVNKQLRNHHEKSSRGPILSMALTRMFHAKEHVNYPDKSSDRNSELGRMSILRVPSPLS